ncbi:MAG: glycosyltransferase family 4 protein [Candidatus Moraniibacteriota bacterium]
MENPLATPPPKKILLFSPFYPPHTGGLESHSDEFNKYLSQTGVQITVFTPQLPDDAPIYETRHNTTNIIRFPAWEPLHNYPLPKYWPFWWSGDFFHLFKNIFREHPDIVITRTRFFSTSLLAVLYAKIKNIPLVHIEHGSDFAQFNSAFKTKLGEIYDWTFGRFVLRSADILIANSIASQTFVHTLSGRSDCQVIYRGVEMKKIASIPPALSLREVCDEAIQTGSPRLKNLPRDDNKIIITYLGRLIDGKGVIDLLQALTHINADSYQACIIGDGPELSRLKKFATANNLTGNISFLGHRKFEDAIGILKSSDIIVNPSYTEGIPTSIIEAALCQKAIIATNVGGTNEIITGDGDGFLIPPKRPDILTKKLQLLIDNPELRKRSGENAFEKVSQKFSWDRAIEAYLALFSKLLDNKKGEI